MVSTFAVALAAVLVLIAVLHVHWAVGGRWGRAAAVPARRVVPASARPDERPAFTPTSLATAAVAALVFLAALAPLGAVGLVPLPVPSAFTHVGVWLRAAALLLRTVGDFRYVGVFKRVRGTRFAKLDTRLYTPLCLLLAALALNVAVGSR